MDKVHDLRHELVREALKLTKLDGGIEVTSISDIPSEGTGLGSSSTYTVGLLNALYAFKSKHVGAEQLAREACKIEVDVLGKPVGKQDQYIASFGGLQYLRFNKNGSVYIDPIITSDKTKTMMKKEVMIEPRTPTRK